MSLSDVNLSPRLLALEVYIFKNCKCLRAICLPQSIGTIGYVTFANCSGLVSVGFPYATAMSTSLHSFAEWISLANILIHSNTDSCIGCRRLQRQQDSAGYSHLTVSRFREYPVQKKYLYNSTTVEEVRQEFELCHVQDTSQHHGYGNLMDSLGRTSFHMLLSSAMQVSIYWTCCWISISLP